MMLRPGIFPAFGRRMTPAGLPRNFLAPPGGQPMAPPPAQGPPPGQPPHPAAPPPARAGPKSTGGPTGGPPAGPPASNVPPWKSADDAPASSHDSPEPVRSTAV